MTLCWLFTFGFETPGQRASNDAHGWDMASEPIPAGPVPSHLSAVPGVACGEHPDWERFARG